MGFKDVCMFAHCIRGIFDNGAKLVLGFFDGLLEAFDFHRDVGCPDTVFFDDIQAVKLHQIRLPDTYPRRDADSVQNHFLVFHIVHDSSPKPFSAKAKSASSM